MKGINIIDKRIYEVDENFNEKLIGIKGHIEPVKVIEINDLDKSFMKHRFNNETLKNLFWSQFELDYIGG